MQFYAFCKFLVGSGIFDRVEVSRLPVGHTYEDIDANLVFYERSSRKEYYYITLH